jgi:hypothetical protein
VLLLLQLLPLRSDPPSTHTPVPGLVRPDRA